MVAITECYSIQWLQRGWVGIRRTCTVCWITITKSSRCGWMKVPRETWRTNDTRAASSTNSVIQRRTGMMQAHSDATSHRIKIIICHCSIIKAIIWDHLFRLGTFSFDDPLLRPSFSEDTGLTSADFEGGCKSKEAILSLSFHFTLSAEGFSLGLFTGDFSERSFPRTRFSLLDSLLSRFVIFLDCNIGANFLKTKSGTQLEIQPNPLNC